MKKVQGSRWLLMVPVLAAGCILYLLGIYEESRGKPDPEIGVIDNLIVPGFLVHTEGCRIPYMNPYDDSIKKYLSKESPFNCSNKNPLIESNQTSIYLVPEALEFYNATSESDLDCCYTPFWRKEVPVGTVDTGADNKIEYSKKCTPFFKSANIYDEYVRVICKSDDVEVYKDFHAFIVPKKINSNHIIEPKPQGPSVLIVGVDAVSRLNFYRQMPKTLKKLNDFKAIEFVGYNKVADNTFPNLVPVFSGYSVEEIEKLCWTDNSVFDDCPWIWKNYSDAGFNTGYGEDACWMGVFNYLKNGFSQPPVDYYTRTYIKKNEDEIGHSKLLNAKYCVGSRFATQILYEYAYKFCSNLTLSNKKYWGFYWGSSLTHDYLNFVPDADDIYVNFLDKIKADGVLENTVVFFMSDHGIRWGGIRETYQGRVEERLPFLYLLLPEWFKEEYNTGVMNALRNRHMLTTPFDVHETMMDLLDLGNVKQEALQRRARELNGKRGISLFLPMPKDRTCESAGIPEEWCTCHQSKNISVLDEKVERAAQTVVTHINDMLFQYIQCAHLSLKEVLSARSETPSDVVKTNSRDQYTDYIVNIMTQPGDAKFEATVRHRSESNSLNVQGYISRINAYGSQSKCILDYRLRLYCYCL